MMNPSEKDPKAKGARVNDEELLAWILGGAGRDGKLPADTPADQRDELLSRVNDWEAFIGSCRAQLQTEEASQPALTDKILAKTVQEDVSVGADWRLVSRFVRQRLAASQLLRIVAASLLLHLGALPVMAYYIWMRPDPARVLKLDFDSGLTELPYGVIEPEKHASPAVGKDSALDAQEVLPRLTEAFALHRIAGANIEQAENVVWTDSLGLVLWVELLLAQESSNPPSARLRFALSALENTLEDQRGDSGRPALRRLGASAWLRARAMGFEFAGSQQAGALEIALRESEYAAWRGTRGPLEGADWLAALKQAQEESVKLGK